MKTVNFWNKNLITSVFSVIIFICMQNVFAYSKLLTLKQISLSGKFTGREPVITEGFFGGKYYLSFPTKTGVVRIEAKEKVPDLAVGMYTSGEGIATIWLKNTSQVPVRIRSISNSSGNGQLRVLNSPPKFPLDVGYICEFKVEFNPGAKGNLSVDVVYGVPGKKNSTATTRITLVPKDDNRVYYVVGGITTVMVSIPLLYKLAKWYWSEQDAADKNSHLVKKGGDDDDDDDRSNRPKKPKLPKRRLSGEDLAPVDQDENIGTPELLIDHFIHEAVELTDAQDSESPAIFDGVYGFYVGYDYAYQVDEYNADILAASAAINIASAL